MSKPTSEMSNEDFAAHMRAKRGVLPKAKEKGWEEKPLPLQTGDSTFSREFQGNWEDGSTIDDDDPKYPFIQCCAGTRWERLKGPKGNLRYGKCEGCGSIQFDPDVCVGSHNRRTGRTTELLDYAIVEAGRSEPRNVYFVAKDSRFAKSLVEEVVALVRKKGSDIRGRERSEVYFHNGGRIFFVTQDWLQGNSFRPGVSDCVIYDHYQRIHESLK